MTEKRCNREFLESALCRQIYNCCNKPYYKAGILINDKDKTKLIDGILSGIITRHFSKYLKQRSYTVNEYRLEFDNGSCFKIILGTSSARGNRYNDLLIDKELTNEVRFDIGYAKILPYYKDVNILETDDSKPEERVVVLVVE